MKSVLMSIQPKWCGLIASGKKTLELRKTKPHFKTPFKVYIYCTKTKTIGDFILCKSKENADLFGYNTAKGINKGFAQAEDIHLKGKVIGEFVCDYILSHCEMANADIAERNSCVPRENILEYSNGKEVFGWHISDLIIYDKPKELSEFYIRDKTYDNSFGWAFEDRPKYKCLTRPPQSWCYVSRQIEKGGAA